jgi:hypothetical protein
MPPVRSQSRRSCGAWSSDTAGHLKLLLGSSCNPERGSGGACQRYRGRLKLKVARLGPPPPAPCQQAPDQRSLGRESENLLKKAQDEAVGSIVDMDRGVPRTTVEVIVDAEISIAVVSEGA